MYVHPTYALAIAAEGLGFAMAERDSGEIIRILDQMILRAVEARASDVHLEPKASRVRVRFRVDGVLLEQRSLTLRLFQPMVSRIKVLANMDIAEKRVPQDGTFKVKVGGNDVPVAVRASTFPSVSGEKVVMRLLLGARTIPLDGLGLAAQQLKAVRNMVKQQSGLILVTGPTGAGKTSTLYALLQEIDTASRNVITLEDPIEVQLPDITQGQVAPKAGFTFEVGLRAVLRQDPDVILVGEMRDLQTARVAVQASLTGHLVLSTLHTNSTVETMTRLVDIGLEPYIVANALVGVISQRLIRKVCPRCVIFERVTSEVSEGLGIDVHPEVEVASAPGCPSCMNTGYRGRMGLFEVLDVDDELRQIIKEKITTGAIKRTLREKGIPSLRRSGLRMVVGGLSTWQELVRIT